MSSKQINNINDVKNLFDDAVQNSQVSQKASQIMINSLNDTNLIGCTGTNVDDLESDDVTLTSIVLDSSGSMSQNQSAVQSSYDELIKALQESKQANSMLVSSRTFGSNIKILYGFKKVSEIGAIGSQYKADENSTRLYDALAEAIAGIRAYSKDLNDNGIRTKCIVVVFSDGEDNDSHNAKARDIKTLSDDCLKSEMFYLAYVGYGIDLDKIADEVGFPNKLTTASSPSEIRRTMGLVSKSIIRASQTQIGPSNSFFQ